jgi:hypothetical protein
MAMMGTPSASAACFTASIQRVSTCTGVHPPEVALTPPLHELHEVALNGLEFSWYTRVDIGWTGFDPNGWTDVYRRWTLAEGRFGRRGVERHAHLLLELVPVAPKRRPGDIEAAGDRAQGEPLFEPALDLAAINGFGHDQDLSAPYGRGSTR